VTRSTGRKRRFRKCILWLVSTVLFLLFVRSCAFSILLGHRFYDVTGHATISVEAVKRMSVPVTVCVGKGGPLERSGVYAHPLGFEEEPATAFTICRIPENDLDVKYDIFEYSSMRPRRMHVYVWLEPHAELVDACKQLGSVAGRLPAEALINAHEESPPDRPCFRPEEGASLGYAIAFRSYFFGEAETHNIRVIPNGYRETKPD